MEANEIESPKAVAEHSPVAAPAPKSSLRRMVVRPLFELVVVFLGVFLAFVLDDYRQERALEQNRMRLLSTFREGLQDYGRLFEGYAQRHANENPAFKAALDAGEIPNFSDMRFIAPQYPVVVIRYMLTSQSFEIFDYPLYVALTSFSSGIERMMFVEDKLTEFSERYTPLVESDDPVIVQKSREQHRNAVWFYRYLEHRREIAAELARQAAALEDRLAELLEED